MPSYNQSTRDAIADIRGGLRVDRATAGLPASTTGSLFTVSGGNILMTLILGEVTTIIEAKANNTKLVANPTTGSTTDLCANLDITGDEVGTFYTISGTAGDALQSGSSGSVIAQAVSVVVAPGVIQLTCGATSTGSVAWSIWYIPLEYGASVAAV